MRTYALVFGAWLLLPAVNPVVAQDTDNTTLRRADVSVTITNDRKYSGTYVASGVARMCGKLDLMMPHRANSFNVEFPDAETALPVRTLSFDADTLRAGGTTTRFFLTVAVRTANGGTPPAYVVRAKEPRFNEPGSATRTTTSGKDILTIEGTATMGTRIDVRVTVVCHPKR